MYRLLSWSFYYLGHWSYRVMCLLDNSETWVSIWFLPYQSFMSWSSTLQDMGGADPSKDKCTTGWPWSKPTEEKE